jgi:hypothetical protein
VGRSRAACAVCGEEGALLAGDGTLGAGLSVVGVLVGWAMALIVVAV